MPSPTGRKGGRGPWPLVAALLALVMLAGLGSRLWQQRQQKQVEARKAVPLPDRAPGRHQPGVGAQFPEQ